MAAQLLRLYPGIRVVGLDRQRSALQTAQTNHPEALHVLGDVTDLPFPDRTFDHVHGSWIIEHVPDPVAALRDVRRVLRPGGTCRFLPDNRPLRTGYRNDRGRHDRGSVSCEQLAFSDRSDCAPGPFA
jgi:ubiquinone/menaquinone biosynthesis C-methylase UbiE